MAVSEQAHASAVAFGTSGCLITGAAGSGKSTLALELLALGAKLVADDRVDLARRKDQVMLSCPAALRGRIEARGVGLIRLPASEPVTVSIWVDLDQGSTERLPIPQNRDLLGCAVPVIFGPNRPGLAAAIMVLLTGGSLTDPEEPVAP